MHWLSSENRSEFLACPQLIRFEYGQGAERFEPTLLIKGSTLLLKYIVTGVPMQLAFSMIEGQLICALRVCDNGSSGGVLWSVIERDQEVKGIRSLARGEQGFAFLFNELAVNVAWNELPKNVPLERLERWLSEVRLGAVDYPSIQKAAGAKLERFHNNQSSDDDWIVLEIEGRSDWKPVQNHFITSGASTSLIDLFDEDEGGQQEQLAVWLTDSLQPTGTHHSPRFKKGAETKELTDVLLSYSFGSTLLESKSLSIFSRDVIPDRSKLDRDISAHIDKAFRQLRGAVRTLKAGVEITDPNGRPLVVERDKPAHAIVLIPDMDLLEDRSTYDLAFIQNFVETTGGFPHLLDVSELLRVVQAAEAISARGNSTTPMMAFDYYLMERLKKAVNADTLAIEVLLRFKA